MPDKPAFLGILTLKAKISKPAQRLFYAQHIHFQVFDDSWPGEKPIFINFIREPVSRFISHFYFRRFSSGKDTKDGYAFTGPRRTAELNINQCVDQGWGLRSGVWTPESWVK